MHETRGCAGSDGTSRGLRMCAVGPLVATLAAACGGQAPASATAGSSSVTGEVGSSGVAPTGASGGAVEGGGTDTGATSGGGGGEASAGGADGAETGETGVGSSGGGDAETDDTGAPPGSRCEQTPELITCPKLTVELGPLQRDVHYQVPLGEPPGGGWPLVLMFQGSLFSAEASWTASEGLPFGAYYQTEVIKELLDHGYAVITPETKLDGATFWDTNVPPYSVLWETSDDHAFMLEIFAAIADGAFGPIDPARWFAAGISSGGYMTSRMAVSYPGEFRSLAVAAGSYATCSGALCSVPAQAASHPPTLFLQGALDLTVPPATVEAYRDALAAAGVDTELVLDPQAGHAWIAAAPQAVWQWFAAHP